MPNSKRKTSLCLDQASFENGNKKHRSGKKKKKKKKTPNKLLLKFTHPIL